MTLAQEAGFDVSKEDWLKHQAQTNLELSDKELEGMAGGVNANPFYTMVPNECTGRQGCDNWDPPLYPSFSNGLLAWRIADRSLSHNALANTGLFNSSITSKASKTASNAWHHQPPPPPILSHFPSPK